MALQDGLTATITANGQYEFTTTPGVWYTVTAAGTFDSATVSVKHNTSVDATPNWVTYKDPTGANVSWTSNDQIEVKATSTQTQIDVSGVVSASDIDVRLVRERV